MDGQRKLMHAARFFENHIQSGARRRIFILCFSGADSEQWALFLQNLLLKERYPLLNRTMHISGALKKHYIGEGKQYIGHNSVRADSRRRLDRIRFLYYNRIRKRTAVLTALGKEYV